MDGFQGAILNVKLKHLDAWNEGRRRNAALYGELLGKGVDGLVAPTEAAYAKHVYHIYAIRVKNRDAFMDALGKKDIATGIHYPVPLHLTGAYSALGYKMGDFPIAEKSAAEFVSLPMFAELSKEQIRYVCEEIKRII